MHRARKHKLLKNTIRKALGTVEYVACFNNEQGTAKYPKPGGKKCGMCRRSHSFYTVKYGVGNGGSDLLCIVRNKASGLGVFVGLEVKTGGAKLDSHQRQFNLLVDRFGGFCFVVRSVGDALEAVRKVHELKEKKDEQ